MRCLICVKKPDKIQSAGVLPDQKILAEMREVQRRVAAAGVLIAAEGADTRDQKARASRSLEARDVTTGPCRQGTLIACGLALAGRRWKRRSMGQACPMSHAEIEIRQVFEAEDFGPAFTRTQWSKNERLRAQVDAKR